MRKIKRILGVLSVMLMLSASALLQAQENSSQRFDQYEIFYSTFNTSFLQPKVAKAYGVVRGKDKALINIAVVETLADGTKQNVNADVTALISDLIHKTEIELTRVQEQNAIYYIGPFDIQHKLDMYFTLQVKPESSKKTYTVSLKKRLYVDGKD